LSGSLTRKAYNTSLKVVGLRPWRHTVSGGLWLPKHAIFREAYWLPNKTSLFGEPLVRIYRPLLVEKAVINCYINPYVTLVSLNVAKALLVILSLL